VRTYVHDAQGRPGVWFYSLDANQWLAVKVARTLFYLPYEHATMSASVTPRAAGKGCEVDFRSRRAGEEDESRFSYQTPAETKAKEAKRGSLEFFLVERYRLFAWDGRGGRLFSGRVHHTPYQITTDPQVTWSDQTMALAGFDVDGRPPEHVAAARAVDVEIWPLKQVAERVRCESESGESLGIGAGAPA